MQLRPATLVFAAIVLLSGNIISQESQQPAEANFLFNYYQQEGENSAVTGGTGTEALIDRASSIIVAVPLDSVSRLSVESSVNHYTSASSDNIDFTVSSASRDDYRGQLYITYQRSWPQQRQELGFRFGGSIETDVISRTAAIDWNWESRDKNRRFSVSARAFWDDWLLIFPAELRSTGTTLTESDKRRTYALSLTYAQVINRRMQWAFFSDFIFQHGLLSTPFHRVYFADQNQPKIEQLPSTRTKLPFGARFNWSVNHLLIARLYYRFYIDSFDIMASTLSAELPLKLPLGLTIYPFYRYHRQSAASYFRDYRKHLSDADFFTSDFDLSAFDSHKQGLGIKFDPLYGLSRFKFPNRSTTTVIQSVELQYADYRRQDGLSFYTISLGLNFLFL